MTRYLIEWDGLTWHIAAPSAGVAVSIWALKAGCMEEGSVNPLRPVGPPLRVRMALGGRLVEVRG